MKAAVGCRNVRIFVSVFWLEQWVVQYLTSSLSCSSVFPDTLSHLSDTSHSPSPPLSPSILPFIPHSHSSHPPIHPSLTPLPSSPHSHPSHPPFTHTPPILPLLTPLPSSPHSHPSHPPIHPSLSRLPSSHPPLTHKHHPYSVITHCHTGRVWQHYTKDKSSSINQRSPLRPSSEIIVKRKLTLSCTHTHTHTHTYTHTNIITGS